MSTSKAVAIFKVDLDRTHVWHRNQHAFGGCHRPFLQLGKLQLIGQILRDAEGDGPRIHQSALGHGAHGRSQGIAQFKVGKDQIHFISSIFEEKLP